MADPTLVIRILAENKSAKKVLDETATSAQKIEKGFASAALPAAAVLGGIALGAAKASDAASRLEQSSGAVSSVFKESADEVTAFGQAAADASGLAQSEYQEMASVLGAQLKNMGRDSAGLAKETDDLIDLGADLAATFGGPTADAVNAVSSLMRGERDPIERYGVSIKQVDIDARLLADGMISAKTAAAQLAKAHAATTRAQTAATAAHKTGTPAQQKAADAALREAKAAEKAARATRGLDSDAMKAATANATLALLTEQTADAQGAFARETDTAAHAQQVANAQIEDATAALGTALLPIIVAVTGFLGGLAVMVRDNAEAFQVIIGIVALVAAGILAVNVAFKAYQAATIAVTAVQWLLNAALAANPIGIVVIAIAALVAALILAYQNSEEFRKIVDAVFAAVVAVIGGAVDFVVGVFSTLADILEEPFRAYLGVVQAVFKLVLSVIGLAVRTITGLFSKLVEVLRTVFGPVAKILTGPFQAAQKIISDIFRALERIVREVVGKITGWLDGIADVIGGVAGAIDSVNPFTAPPPAAARAVAGPWTRSGRAATTSGSAGGITVNVYTTGDTLEAEQAVVRALRRTQRLNAGRVLPAFGVG